MSELRTKGLVFPLELSTVAPIGSHVIAEGASLIESSIKIIIAWPLFTRDYVDGFGSRIYEALEDQNDDVLISLVKKFIIDSITKWEQRVELKKLSFSRPNNERLIVDLTYLIKDINIESSSQYTFYTN